DAAGDEWCLRRWPAEHPTVERLRLIHGVLRLVSNELPIVAYPLRTAENTTFVEHGGHLWELTNWLPGEADYHSRPSRERLRAAMRVLGRFHAVAGRFEGREGFALAVVGRERQVAGMREMGLGEIERALGG